MRNSTEYTYPYTNRQSKANAQAEDTKYDANNSANCMTDRVAITCRKSLSYWIIIADQGRCLEPRHYSSAKETSVERTNRTRASPSRSITGCFRGLYKTHLRCALHRIPDMATQFNIRIPKSEIIARRIMRARAYRVRVSAIVNTIVGSKPGSRNTYARYKKVNMNAINRTADLVR